MPAITPKPNPKRLQTQVSSRGRKGRDEDNIQTGTLESDHNAVMEYIIIVITLLVFGGLLSLHFEDDIRAGIQGVQQRYLLRKPSATASVEMNTRSNETLIADLTSKGKIVGEGVQSTLGTASLTWRKKSKQSILQSSSSSLSPKTTSEIIDLFWKEYPDLNAVASAFNSHPLYRFDNMSSPLALADYIVYLSSLQKPTSCSDLGKPVILSMARMPPKQPDLYWQLVENYFFTMLIFGHSYCSIMICVSDPDCMSRCRANGFPCFDYRPMSHNSTTTAASLVEDVHVMEQVAEIKIFHVSKALERGANIFLLDLDVGFLRDPLILFQNFLDNPLEQVRAQMDVGSSTEKKTKTWYTHPRPNFGVFIIKSHPYSVKAFQNAWKNYLKSTSDNKKRVATDQNAVVGALKWARWRWNYNFSYFYIGYHLDTQPRPIIPTKVILLDKMHNVNHNGILYELGGSVAEKELGDAVAVHATCFEGSTKVQGLQASGAYWNIPYYQASRRTLTKPLIALSKRSLRLELQALAYLAIKTNRSLIIPNVLVGVGNNIKGQKTLEECKEENPRSAFCHEVSDSRNRIADQDQSHAALHRGEYYWPGWRVVMESLKELDVLEPNFYYRMQKSLKIVPPQPTVARFDLAGSKIGGVGTLLDMLLANISKIDSPRLVLDLYDSVLGPEYRGGPEDIYGWAEDSVGSWGDGVISKTKYLPLPPPNPNLHFTDEMKSQFDICRNFLMFIPGNRSCFDKCRQPI